MRVPRLRSDPPGAARWRVGPPGPTLATSGHGRPPSLGWFFNHRGLTDQRRRHAWWERTCTCVPYALHTLQRVHRDRNARARAFPPAAWVAQPSSGVVGGLVFLVAYRLELEG